jgi:hypothetical protein
MSNVQGKRVVKVEAPPQPSASAVTCRHCDQPFPATDDGFLFKYFLVQRPNEYPPVSRF